MPAIAILLTLFLFALYWAALASWPRLRPPFLVLGMMVALPLRLFVNWRRAGWQGAARLAFVGDPLAMERNGTPLPPAQAGDNYLYLRGAGIVLGALMAIFTGAWILAGQARVATQFGGITLGGNLAASVSLPVQAALYFALFILFTQLGWRLGALWLHDAVTRKRRAALHELADFLDMLAVCMSAGAEFDRAFEVAVIKWGGEAPLRFGVGSLNFRGGWLKADLVQALIERNMGLARAEIFANLARRALGPGNERGHLGRDDAGEASPLRRDREEILWAELVRAVERSRDLGTPLQAGFAALAERIRAERFARAEESAQRASAATWLPQILLVVSMVITILTGVVLSLVGLFATAGP